MPVDSGLPCKELVELVTDYLEGALSPEDRVRFEEHLAICPGCETYLEQMRLVIRTLGRLTEDDIPPKAKRELLETFRNWKSQH
jgi:predicted anti-sigma-YlaC factor YlaD